MIAIDNRNESQVLDNGLNSEFSDLEQVNMIKRPFFSFMFLICVEVVIGNILSVITVLKNKAFGNKSTTNYFIISLAISDLIVGALVMPTGVICFIVDTWIFGQIWCELWQTFDVLSCTASILNLCAISLDRYWAISDPLNYTIKMKKLYVASLIVGIWVLSAFITIPPFIWSRIYDQYHCTSVSCECHSLYVNPSFAIFLTIISFFVPLFLMAIVNYRTYRIAIKQIYAIYSDKKQKPNVPLRHHPISDGKSAAKKRSYSLIQKQFKVTKTLGIVLGVFIICWMPYFIVYSVNAFCHSCVPNKNVVFPIALWLGWLNSGMNPIIYTCLSKKFRKSIASNLVCKSNHGSSSSLR
ncbi:dopamine receptor 2-like protein [Dinothrombium tinctorium]|uniref:Dopamine receptor 2-like protein n=1 Tax=Dinothrombium tinctorium TaxID=1965070 RepID=A0A443R810_9ACAR|nr:dopamine receptor 2-like protein [Dinothrombium tinctorium]RWS11398.1 dopamine receptor 2-like protein [Dinothrombium tinctorium]